VFFIEARGSAVITRVYGDAEPETGSDGLVCTKAFTTVCADTAEFFNTCNAESNKVNAVTTHVAVIRDLGVPERRFSGSTSDHNSCPGPATCEDDDDHEWETRKTPSGQSGLVRGKGANHDCTGGGGEDPPPPELVCYDEDIYIQVCDDINDPNPNWHTVWNGTATVCEYAT
jgi:hypothetical protein